MSSGTAIWSSYRETALGERGAAAIRLADMLRRGERFRDADSGVDVLASRGGDPFAKGRYRAIAVRPSVQYFDFDMEMMSSNRICGIHPSSLCLNLILDGHWTTVVEGKCYQAFRTGMPCVFAAGNPFESVMVPKRGQRIQAVSLYISGEFFAADVSGADSLMDSFSRLLRPGFQYHELRRCDVLRSIMLKLHENPYHGVMARLHAESLALSALVELAAHTEGACRTRRQRRSNRDHAHAARLILDQEMASLPPISAVARRVGTTEITLRRQFKAAFGVTMANYVRNSRLEAARHLLREGGLHISEIAYRVGYSEPANFTAAYRHRFGYPPSQELVRPSDRSAQGNDQGS